MAASNYLTPQVPVGGPTPVCSPDSPTIRLPQALPTLTTEDVFFRLAHSKLDVTAGAQPKLGITTNDAAAEGAFAVQVHGYAEADGPGILLDTVLTGNKETTALNTGSLFIGAALASGYPLYSFRVTVLGGYSQPDIFKFYVHFGA